MFKKYLKYIYAIIIFYAVWLLIIPFSFRFISQPVVSVASKITGYKINIENPRLRTNIVPNIKFFSDKIEVLNDDNTTALALNNFKLNLRLLPLITGKVHLNSIEMKDCYINLFYKDKLYLGQYPITISTDIPDIKLDRIKTGLVQTNLFEKKDKYIFETKDFYFKSNKKSIILKGNLICKTCTDIFSKTDFDIYLPQSIKNSSKTKFNIKTKDFKLKPFSNLVSVFDNGIKNLEGSVDFTSDKNGFKTKLNDVKIIYKNPYYSILFPKEFNIISKYKLSKNIIKINCLKSLDKDVKFNVAGEISDIFSTTPDFDLNVVLDKSDMRKGALMLPNIITEDVSIPKVKQYPFYGDIYGKLNIKGSLPKPDITGFVKAENGVLVHPIKNAKKGAEVKINFVGQKLLLDVLVSAGFDELVEVSGDVLIYDDRYAHLWIRSSKNVDLETTQNVLNPLHEMLCFLIGPVPIMDINGIGNIDIKVKGTKKHPHIWGSFNFRNTDARFLKVNNFILRNAMGSLIFDNQNAYFKNNTGTLRSQPATIEGVCNLYGKLNFNVHANNQQLNDLIKTLKTSPMLEEMSTVLPDDISARGRADFYLNLTGQVLDVENVKINENIFAKGYVRLKNDLIKYNGLSISSIKGLIEFDKTDYKVDLDALLLSSKIKITGIIKNNIGNILVNSQKLYVNNLDKKIFKPFDNLYVKLNAKYKGRLDKIEIGGIDANIEVLKNPKPKKNTRIISGKIILKNSNLSISNFKGIIKKDLFNVNMSAKNIGKKELNLKRARLSGEFNCKNFDLTTINLIKQAKILPTDIQKELDKLNIVYGNAKISAKINNNKINSVVNLDTLKFEYSVSEGLKKEIVTIPVKLISGQLVIKNDRLFINKWNCLVDEMPLLLYGCVDNIYKAPKYNLHINSKLVQRVFDKYWNSYNIYPIKVNGDILFSSRITGDKNKTNLKTDIRMEENSSMYYMGATLGDTLEPITINVDTDFDKSGLVKINRFDYNKLVSSQNNKQYVLPLLSVKGEIKQDGKILKYKNLLVKTENPTNANLFNIIFKKPTIKQGNFTSDIKINGTSLAPKILGKFDVSNVEMPYLNTTVKALHLTFVPDTIFITVRSEILSNYIMFNAKIKNNFKLPYSISSADIYVNDFDINRSINMIKQIELRGLSSAISKNNEKSDLLNSLIFDNVKIRAGSVKIKNIKASNLEAEASLNERMHLDVNRFKFNMASGTITGKMGYNILNSFMKMELSASDVDANAMAIALFDLPNQIKGSLSGHIDMSCNATNDKTRLETLNGYTNFKVANGRMPKLGSLEYLLKASNLLAGGITRLSMNNLIDVIIPTQTGDFSSINGRIRIKDGIMNTIEIQSLGKDLNLFMTGSLNFHTNVADMRVFGQISKKVSTVLGAAGNLSLNTLFNKIPGINLNKSYEESLNKVPSIEMADKMSRKFVVEILGDVNGDNFVKSFKWIN